MCIGLPTDYTCEFSHSYIGNGRAWAFPFMGSLPSIWEVLPYMGSPRIDEKAFHAWAVFPHVRSIPMYEKPSCIWQAIPYMGRLPILGTHVVMVASGADFKDLWQMLQESYPAVYIPPHNYGRYIPIVIHPQSRVPLIPPVPIHAGPLIFGGVFPYWGDTSSHYFLWLRARLGLPNLGPARPAGPEFQ